MKHVKINDHFFELVPRPTKKEMQILTESIMQNGQREPIVLNHNHFILDGHSRFEVCQNLGIEPKCRIMKFDSYEEEEAYVVECNMQRRQVNNFQKIEIYYKYYEKIKKNVQSKKQRDSHGRIMGMNKGVSGTRSIEILADKLKLPVNQVQCGIWLIKNTNEKYKIKLRTGSITINKAFDNRKRVTYNKTQSITFKSMMEHFHYDDSIISYLIALKERFKDEKQRNISVKTNS